MINLYHGDCLEVMKDIPDNSVDLIVSDIPYKIISGGCTNDAVKIKATKFMGDILNRFDDKTRDLVKSGKLFEHNDIKFSEFFATYV